MDWEEVIIYYVAGVVLVLIGIIMIMIKNSSKEPIDDSRWNINLDNVKEKLKKFIGEKEEIVGILGMNNIVQLMTQGNDKNGFCILTDKAFYFIGKVLSERNGSVKKGNIQQRINIESYRAIGATKKNENLFRLLLGIAIVEICMVAVALYDLLVVIGGSDAEITAVIYLVIAVIALVEAVFCAVNIKVGKTLVVEIEFVNEKYIFKVNQLGKEEIKTFYRQLSSLNNKESSTTT